MYLISLCVVCQDILIVSYFDANYLNNSKVVKIYIGVFCKPLFIYFTNVVNDGLYWEHIDGVTFGVQF